ncbi:hypothetical protein [Marispirochaeta aestuarii]|uniref:hypothetical protein n=1 Tax=Marispirochaeta aestuarii TaxID=1963862 RepID=UPI002ABD502D|nr:hypothetical protein [Marispirochaeta aestuarii]
MVDSGRSRKARNRAFLLVVVLVFVSCTTRNEPFAEIDNAVNQGNYAQAAQAMSGDERSTYYRDKDKVLYYLDVGMLYHYAGDYELSTQNLNEAEILIEQYFTKSISQAAGSLLLNDNVMDYAGEDYEDIYLNVFKSLNFLSLGDFDAGFVEVRKVNTKLNLLEDKYSNLAAGYNSADDAEVELKAGENRFYSSALARYVSLLMYRGEGDYDGARIDYNKIVEAFLLQPDIYEFEPPVDESTLRPPDGARLSVLAFAGRSPLKKAKTLTIVTGPNTVSILTMDEDDAGQLIPTGYNSFFWPGIDGGYRFKFQLPYIEPQGSAVDTIRLVVDAQPLGQLKMIENMERVAEATFQVKYPIIFMKTVTRTIVKGILAQMGKQQLQEQGGLALGLLGSIVADIAVEASEQADLRTARYFPAHAYMGEFDLPEGEHFVELEYYSGGTLLQVDELGMMNLTKGGLNLATSYSNK